MHKIPYTAEDRLLCQFGRLLKLAFHENPLAKSGVSLPQLTLLDWIAINPGCILREIAEGLSLTPPTVSVAVRRLENSDLLLREPDPDDGRVVRFSLTMQGYALYESALAYRQDKMRQLIQGLSPAEVESLVTLLEKAINTASGQSCT